MEFLEGRTLIPLYVLTHLYKGLIKDNTLKAHKYMKETLKKKGREFKKVLLLLDLYILGTKKFCSSLAEGDPL
jgi:hypothetical protein